MNINEVEIYGNEENKNWLISNSPAALMFKTKSDYLFKAAKKKKGIFFKESPISINSNPQKKKLNIFVQCFNGM